MDDKLGYQKEASSFIARIIETLAYTVAALDGIKEGEGTLLDRTLLMAHSESGFAKIHSLENIPMMMIGNAGGRVKTGMHIAAKGDPVTRVGLTVQQAMGVATDNWGTLSLNTNKSFGETLAV